jgi:hypothetical protein
MSVYALKHKQTHGESKRGLFDRIQGVYHGLVD